MTKLCRIGYTEDNETHYTQAFDPDTISVLYKDFDREAVKPDCNMVFWVESLEGEWKVDGK